MQYRGSAPVVLQMSTFIYSNSIKWPKYGKIFKVRHITYHMKTQFPRGFSICIFILSPLRCTRREYLVACLNLKTETLLSIRKYYITTEWGKSQNNDRQF
jgi:hypothetical protein